jgi:hypothetical protein
MRRHNTTPSLLLAATVLATVSCDTSPFDLQRGLPRDVVDAGALACDVLADSLARDIYAQSGACTAVIRMSRPSLELLGYRLICGPTIPATRQTAEVRAESDTAIGITDETDMLNQEPTDDEYVFFKDASGGAAVSAATTLTVFGGTTFRMGVGAIVYPLAWDPPTELGPDCPSGVQLPTMRGWSLTYGSAIPNDVVVSPWQAADRTGIPAAFARGGAVSNVVVLEYATTVDFAPGQSSEWVVLVNGTPVD